MNFIMHTFDGLKCLTETKIQIFCDHINHTSFHIVEMGCQMVELLSATMFINLTPAFDNRLAVEFLDIMACMGLSLRKLIETQARPGKEHRPTDRSKQGNLSFNHYHVFSCVSLQWQFSETTERKNQALVRATPFCGEYPGPQFEDKFRSANQMDEILKAGADKMAAS